MTQTIENEYSQSTYPYREYIGSCRPLITEYKTASTSQRFKVTNDPEHRPFPSQPLFLHPTSQAEQMRSVKGACHYYNEATYMERCGSTLSPYKMRTHTKTLRNFSLNAPYGLGTDYSSDVRNKIKDDFVNLASNLAEYRETANMFGDFAKSVSSAYKALRKGRLPKKFRGTEYWVSRGKKVRKSNFGLSDLGAAELLTSFGIVPLASDVLRSIDALQYRFDYPIYKRVCTTSQDGVIDVVQDSTWTTEYDWDLSERVVIWVKVIPDDRRITVGNPLEWLWEATPFSFVIDWGFNVGSYLSSLDALKGVLGMIGTKTTKTHCRARAYVTSPSSSVTWVKDATFTMQKFRRGVITQIPLPRAPRWKPSPSYRKLAHATSLFAVMRRGKTRGF